MRRYVLAGIASVMIILAANVVSSRMGGGPSVSSGPASGDLAVSTTATADPATTAAPATAAPAPDPRGNGNAITFAFAGDVNFPDEWGTEGGSAPSAPTLHDQLVANPKRLLDPVAPTLRQADLAVVNLETAITDGGEPVAGKNYHFRSPAAAFTALKAAGVDVVNMANNHALDYGPDGMADTFAAIKASGVAVVGIGHDAAEAYRPFTTTVRGQRVGIVSANDWLEPDLVAPWSATDSQPGIAFSIDRTRLLQAVRDLRPQVDTLVTFLHWGTEETWCASSAQQDLAQALMEAGADLVVGSHTHRVFGVGKSGPSLVAYGLGNFVYWREDGESGRSGILLATVTGREVDSYSWVPARIANGVAIPATGDAAATDLAEWERRRSCSGLAP
jgi:poly-gamma-glutamate synthesis protein (capsule biosynthesis protein)